MDRGIRLQRIADRSRSRCCGTCAHWYDRNGVYCPVLDRMLTERLTETVCACWERERGCSDARDLWRQLGGEDQMEGLC